MDVICIFTRKFLWRMARANGPFGSKRRPVFLTGRFAYSFAGSRFVRLDASGFGDVRLSSHRRSPPTDRPWRRGERFTRGGPSPDLSSLLKVSGENPSKTLASWSEITAQSGNAIRFCGSLCEADILRPRVGRCSILHLSNEEIDAKNSGNKRRRNFRNYLSVKVPRPASRKDFSASARRRSIFLASCRRL